MQRRRALVVAGTLTATLAMAGTAMAVNLGLLGADSDPVGELNPTELQPAAEVGPQDAAKPRVRVIVQDIPVGGGSTGSGSAGVETAPAPSDDERYDDRDDHDDEYDDEDGYEDDHDEDDDDDHDGYEEHEDEEHEDDD